uniref:ARAD1B14300p n=1 Tax=Blastobotrys adeninivorans TaxID=409370 RepID=A0A060TBA2_BLAAD
MGDEKDDVQHREGGQNNENGGGNVVGEDYTHYLFADNAMAKELAGEPGCSISVQDQVIPGYELYIVEQWSCARKPTCCIVTFTGKSDHKVTTTIVRMPADPAKQSPKVHSYFEALNLMHSRPKDTAWGHIFVTNLSSFPSNLNLVPVIGGDLQQAWSYFCVNENLRRTNCGGRLVLSITPPYDASEAKFRQIFRPHDRVPIMFAVRELVTLVQISLYYFNLLEPRFVDGLLCDETIKAINMWWSKFAPYRYECVRPKDGGSLGPTTVSAIIGFVTGARHRMASVINYKVSKDPFDVAYFTESIRQFQKHEHLPRTMRLDEDTVERLYQLTGRSFLSSPAFFGMVKTTMKEVSGKQVTGASDVETLDMEKFRMALAGPRERYLWLGKGHMRSLSASSDPDSLSGIPITSLSCTEFNNSSRDIRKAMKRSVATQKQRTDEAIRSKFRNLQARLEANDSDSETGDECPLIEGVDSSYSRRRDKSGLLKSMMKGHRPSRSTSHPKRLSIEEEQTQEGSSYKLPNCSVQSCDGKEICPAECREDESLIGPLRRRASFPGVNMDSCKEPGVDKLHLRRHNSFARIENAVLRWSLPFVYPPERLFKSCANACFYHDKLVQEVMVLQQTTQKCRDADSRVQQYLQDNQRTVEKIYEQREQVDNKQKALNISLHDVDTLASRLQYEVRTLESKIRDVEESVDSFQSKVSTIVARIDRMADHPPTHPNKRMERHDDASSNWTFWMENWMWPWLSWFQKR